MVSTNLAVPLATACSAPAFGLALLLSYRFFRRAVLAAGLVLDWGGGARPPAED
ncbi:hypothetical protein [Microlunatus elymi]|uniref:hypothetical protein n=1 Tax=Microlunatus elymi TaxID=2596828 RepID=UPI00143D384F|nr:hypothetical protein [Microlunatus elymi]